jgi:hypothetical protein
LRKGTSIFQEEREICAHFPKVVFLLRAVENLIYESELRGKCLCGKCLSSLSGKFIFEARNFGAAERREQK